MRINPNKSVSKLLGIWSFLLLLIIKGAFPKPAFALLDSESACLAQPPCAAAISSEVATSVAAPTAEGVSTTITATTAAGASTTTEAAAGVTVIGDMRLSGVAAYYIWSRGVNGQAQERARQRYCAAYPTDTVCVPFTGGQSDGIAYDVTYRIFRENGAYWSQSTYRYWGPIKGARWYTDFSNPWSGSAPEINCRGSGYGQIKPTLGWYSHEGYAPPPMKWFVKITNVVRSDGQPDTGDNPPPLPWEDWPQEKRSIAVASLTNPDWLDLINSMPEGGRLPPGGTVKAPIIVIPGQEEDDPNTPADERLLRKEPGFFTNPANPSPEPSPSPSPDPSPSPSPSPTEPTASGNPPNPSPSPSPSPSDEDPTEEENSPTAAPLNSNSVVIDSQISIALDKAARGEPLNVAQQAAVDWVARKRGEGAEIHETATTVREVKEGNENYQPFKDVPMTVDRSSPEYQAVLQQLENNNVGDVPPKGQDDRNIVADTFFAETDTGVKPTLATQDKDVYNKLAPMAGIDPARTGQGVQQAYPNGFDLTVSGRTIRVIPVSNK